MCGELSSWARFGCRGEQGPAETVYRCRAAPRPTDASRDGTPRHGLAPAVAPLPTGVGDRVGVVGSVLPYGLPAGEPWITLSTELVNYEPDLPRRGKRTCLTGREVRQAEAAPAVEVRSRHGAAAIRPRAREARTSPRTSWEYDHLRSDER